MTDDECRLKIVREAFAKQIAHLAQAADPRIASALAATPRERFLPPGPWQIMRMMAGYVSTPDDDPVYVYQDAAIAILPDRQLNNGQPSFLTFLIALGRPRDGEHVVHIGAGLGYYTAIIAQLVSPTGKTTAIEHDPDLARAAAGNLSCYPNVTVLQGDGSAMVLEPADVIYVNAGASKPTESWLDALKPGGRLVLPLTVGFTSSQGTRITKGAIFLIEKSGDEFLARYASPTIIYPCAGARDDASETALAAAFRREGIERVTRLRRTDDIPQQDCWLKAPGWCLSFCVDFGLKVGVLPQAPPKACLWKPFIWGILDATTGCSFWAFCVSGLAFAGS